MASADHSSPPFHKKKFKKKLFNSDRQYLKNITSEQPLVEIMPEGVGIKDEFLSDKEAESRGVIGELISPNDALVTTRKKKKHKELKGDIVSETSSAERKKKKKRSRSAEIVLNHHLTDDKSESPSQSHTKKKKKKRHSNYDANFYHSLAQGTSKMASSSSSHRQAAVPFPELNSDKKRKRKFTEQTSPKVANLAQDDFEAKSRSIVDIPRNKTETPKVTKTRKLLNEYYSNSPSLTTFGGKKVKLFKDSELLEDEPVQASATPRPPLKVGIYPSVSPQSILKGDMFSSSLTRKSTNSSANKSNTTGNDLVRESTSESSSSDSDNHTSKKVASKSISHSLSPKMRKPLSDLSSSKVGNGEIPQLGETSDRVQPKTETKPSISCEEPITPKVFLENGSVSKKKTMKAFKLPESDGNEISLSHALKLVAKKEVKRNRNATAVPRDFLDKALEGAKPFGPRTEPSDNDLSMNNFFHPILISQPDVYLKKFAKYCHRHEKRPLPILNAINPLLTIPKSLQLKLIMEKFPNFKLRKFSIAEDEIILRNFGSLAATLNFNKEDCESFLERLIMKRKENYNIRLYLGAVVGWEMLPYRLAIDIYTRLIHLLRLSRQHETLTDLKTVKKIAVTFEALQPTKANDLTTELNLKLKVVNSKLQNFLGKAFEVQSLESSSENMDVFQKSGRFTVNESCVLLNLVMQQQGVSKHEDLMIEKINFDSLAPQLKRAPNSLRYHFLNTVICALKSGEIDADLTDSIDQQLKFFQKIYQDEQILCRRDIHWKKLAKELNINNERLRTIYSSHMKRLESSKAEFDFKEAIGNVVQKLRKKQNDPELWSQTRTAQSKQVQIREFYEKNYLNTA